MNHQRVGTTDARDAPATTLILVFVHGFKGTEQSFAEFPKRLQHILSETIPNTSVDSIVFPAYETKGDLNEAVLRFADWLTTLTVEREVASGGGSGSVKLVLCGHSMGGLLIADTLLEFNKSRVDATVPLWPNIIACIGFDTPYLGLHPNAFKHNITQAAEYAGAAQAVGSALLGSFAAFGVNKASTSAEPQTPSSQGWRKWATPTAYALGGAMLAGAVAGGVFYNRADLTEGWSWATDHMKYVGSLWDEEALRRRVRALIDMEAKYGIIFRTFYVEIPVVVPPFNPDRHFILLPKPNSPESRHFIPSRNTLMANEVQAHTSMFEPNTNDGYYQLGLAASKIIQEAVGTPRVRSMPEC